MKNLEKIALNLPSQMREPARLEWIDRISQNPKSLVVCGMGGSGITGDIIHALLPDIPVRIHKSYGLPTAYRTNSLFLMVSYSGNTEETLSAYDQAVKEKKSIAVITGGGSLLDRAKKDGIPHAVISHAAEIPARFSVGPCTRAALEIIGAVGLIDSAEEVLSALKDLDPQKEIAFQIADTIKDSIVLIYSSEELFGLAEIWKVILNESAKMPAFVNSIPEALHNEVESIASMKNPHLILLDDPQQDNRVSERFDALESLAKNHDWKYTKVTLNHPERIIDLTQSTMLALLAGLEVAKQKNIDPIKTPLIDELKGKT